MELLETQDPEKRKLIETSERHKREIEKEVTAMTQKTERVVTNALVIGGALALTYLAVSQLTKSSKRKKKKKKALVLQAAAPKPDSEEIEDDDESDNEPSVLTQIGTKVVNQATLILLDLARQKLAEYMLTRKNEDEPSRNA
jgi:hypothetical protein